MMDKARNFIIGKIFIISGPSGSGKTTLYKKLLSSEKFKGILVKSISVTTRTAREGEKNGREYIFVSPKMFEFKRRTNQFLEYQKVFDNYYGTPHKSVGDLLKQGKNVLLCIDVKGASVVRKIVPYAVTIFIKVPAMAILEKRLKQRQSETTKDLKLRLKTAAEEMKQTKHYDYVVVNDDLVHAYRKLEKIIEAELTSCHSSHCSCEHN